MKAFLFLCLLTIPAITIAQKDNKNKLLRVKTVNGIVEGTDVSGISTFKGIPFAQPPVGELRWKPPQSVKNWEGILQADQFGPRAMQRAIFSDMQFRSDGMSEDCLYLNVWTPAKTGDERLPVLVYFYGGGLFAGDGSEPRYDGESMARKGIVTLTVNYRLNVFGFFAHPELTKESPQQASGNYGYLDQQAALHWVQENIASFGGDPARVTIAGESAGSISVSAQMASPLSRRLIAGAIGESGSLLGALPAIPLADAEENGVKFAKMLGEKSLAALRSMPADELLEATAMQGTPRFSSTVDGYFLPKPPMDIYTAGEQAQVPLLLGWNSEEMNYRYIMRDKELTPENYAEVVKKLYGNQAEEALSLYGGTTNEEIMQAATDLAGDRFIGYSTWKWGDIHAKTGGNPVYRYYYTRPRPRMRADADNDNPSVTKGAVHSAEIEYAMGNLPTNRVYDWQPEDYQVSAIMQEYFANFIKHGNPNGLGVPEWPAINSGETPKVMYIDVDTNTKPEQHRDRYLFLDQLHLSN